VKIRTPSSMSAYLHSDIVLLRTESMDATVDILLSFYFYWSLISWIISYGSWPPKAPDDATSKGKSKQVQDQDQDQVPQTSNLVSPSASLGAEISRYQPR